MNKKTRAVDEDTFKVIVSIMRNGFAMDGVSYKPNDRIATILVIEYNMGLLLEKFIKVQVFSWLCSYFFKTKLVTGLRYV